jgi:hypothetical protein
MWNIKGKKRQGGRNKIDTLTIELHKIMLENVLNQSVHPQQCHPTIQVKEVTRLGLYHGGKLSSNIEFPAAHQQGQMNLQLMVPFETVQKVGQIQVLYPQL